MRAVICNVGRFDWFHHTSMRPYQILGRGAEEQYRLTIIDDSKDRFDLGEEQYVFVPIDGRDIAKDIVRLLNGDAFGLFVCKSDRPTQAELDAAKVKRKTYNRRMLLEGDTEWAKTGKHENIDDNSRRAAIEEGELRPWAASVVDKVACPSCGTLMVKDMAKCPTGCIVNVDKALAAGLITKQQWQDIKEARAGQAPIPKVTKGPKVGHVTEASI